MGRKISITKESDSTVVKIKATGAAVTQTVVYNKNTNLKIKDSVLQIMSEQYPTLFITFEQLEDDLGTSNIEDWVTAATALFFFVVEGDSSPGGIVIPSDLISEDDDNALVIGSDNKLFVPKFFIEVTKAELDDLIAAEELIQGATYKITGVHPTLYDDGTASGTTIFLKAISTTELETNGMGLFYNPNYNLEVEGFGIWNNISDYIVGGIIGTFVPNEIIIADNAAVGKIFGTITGNRFIAISGDWASAVSITGDTSGDTADISSVVLQSYSEGDVAFWGGYAWKNLLGEVGNFTDVFNLNVDNWLKLDYSSSNYIPVYDEIKYDYANDVIYYRADKAGNEVTFTKSDYNYFTNIYGVSNSSISVFQWGVYADAENLGTHKNKVINAYCENVNFRGRSNYNNIYGQGTLSYNNIYDVTASNYNNTYGQFCYNADNLYSQESSNYNNCYSKNVNNSENIYGRGVNNIGNNYGQDTINSENIYNENVNNSNNNYSQTVHNNSNKYGKETTNYRNNYDQEVLNTGNIYGESNNNSNNTYGVTTNNSDNVYGKGFENYNNIYEKNVNNINNSYADFGTNYNNVYGINSTNGNNIYGEGVTNYNNVYEQYCQNSNNNYGMNSSNHSNHYCIEANNSDNTYTDEVENSHNFYGIAASNSENNYDVSMENKYNSYGQNVQNTLNIYDGGIAHNINNTYNNGVNHSTNHYTSESLGSFIQNGVYESGLDMTDVNSSSSTIIFLSIPKTIYRKADNSIKIRYYSELDVLTIVDITA